MCVRSGGKNIKLKLKKCIKMWFLNVRALGYNEKNGHYKASFTIFSYIKIFSLKNSQSKWIAAV